MVMDQVSHEVPSNKYLVDAHGNCESVLLLQSFAHIIFFLNRLTIPCSNVADVVSQPLHAGMRKEKM